MLRGIIAQRPTERQNKISYAVRTLKSRPSTPSVESSLLRREPEKDEPDVKGRPCETADHHRERRRHGSAGGIARVAVSREPHLPGDAHGPHGLRAAVAVLPVQLLVILEGRVTTPQPGDASAEEKHGAQRRALAAPAQQTTERAQA